MKTRIILFLFCLCTLSAAGQGITRQRCATCGKLKVQCPYKGNHPVEKKCTSCGKVISKCPYKGNHPAPQPVEKTCPSCGKSLSKCSFNGKHPAPEAAGYDVNFSCNASSTTLYIDGVANGSANGTHFLKTGNHNIKVMAKGYEEYTEKIDVRATSRSFSFTLTRTFANLTIMVNGVPFQMIAVKGGTFMMGSDVNKNEMPLHQVTLNNYYIGQTEVTQGQWQAVMGNNPSIRKGENLPVENISWEDCQIFIEKLNSMTGNTFRLPTEAEWEFAARGGTNSRGDKYSGNNYILDKVAWYVGNSNQKPHTVATKQANELDIYDMSGNVYEWCSDWYGNYNGSAETNPNGVKSGVYKVLRGGSWTHNDQYNRSSSRGYDVPNTKSGFIGLRLVLIKLKD